jgi:hypothetical protein
MRDGPVRKLRTFGRDQDVTMRVGPSNIPQGNGRPPRCAVRIEPIARQSEMRTGGRA